MSVIFFPEKLIKRRAYWDVMAIDDTMQELDALYSRLPPKAPRAGDPGIQQYIHDFHAFSEQFKRLREELHRAGVKEQGYDLLPPFGGRYVERKETD